MGDRGLDLPSRCPNGPPAGDRRGSRPARDLTLAGLIGLRRNYPAVRWQDGVRYVDDGDLITTAGVLSGVGGALRVVERMVGQAAAARAVAWPAYSPGTAAPIQRLRPAPADGVAVLSAGYWWDRPSMGVLLTEGVGETELAPVLAASAAVSLGAAALQRPSAAWPLFFATGAVITVARLLDDRLERWRS